jgi:hypothetical protein
MQDRNHKGRLRQLQTDGVVALNGASKGAGAVQGPEEPGQRVGRLRAVTGTRSAGSPSTLRAMVQVQGNSSDGSPTRTGTGTGSGRPWVTAWLPNPPT